MSPLAEPSALVTANFGWVASAVLAVKVTEVGMAGKATAAPLASVPERPVAKTSGAAVVPPEVNATSALAVCVFCVGVMFSAPIFTSAVAIGVSLPPKQAASTSTSAVPHAQRAGLLPKLIYLFMCISLKINGQKRKRPVYITFYLPSRRFFA